jgi:hypothetical protein
MWMAEVIGVAATPGAIRYRDLTNGIEGVLLSVYVRRAKQRQHSKTSTSKTWNARAAQWKSPISVQECSCVGQRTELTKNL